MDRMRPNVWHSQPTTLLWIVCIQSRTLQPAVSTSQSRCIYSSASGVTSLSACAARAAFCWLDSRPGVQKPWCSCLLCSHTTLSVIRSAQHHDGKMNE